MTQEHTFNITLKVRANRTVNRNEIAADLERLLTQVQESDVPDRGCRSPHGSAWWTNDVRAARID